MKIKAKYLFYIAILVLCVLVLFGCKQEKPDNPPETVPDSTKLETIAETNTIETEQNNSAHNFKIPSWQNEIFNNTNTNDDRKYIDAFYDIDMLVSIVDESEIIKYTFNDFIYNYDEDLPVIYQYIKGLKISKDDFIEANNTSRAYNRTLSEINLKNRKYIYSNDEIESFFSDTPEEIIVKFHTDNYIYYKGNFYELLDMYELFRKDKDYLIEFLYCGFKSETNLFFNSYHKLIQNDIAEYNRDYIIQDMYKSVYNGGQLYEYYPNNLMENGFPSVFYKKAEVRQYYNEHYFEKSIEELNYLPTAYYLIKDMSLKDRKDEFYALNEDRIFPQGDDLIYFLLENQFEILFGNYDEETIKKELKSPTAFYYEGKLYNIDDLKKADPSLIDSMGTGDEFKEYLTQLKEFRVYKESEEIYGEMVNGWLEKYYSIKS